MEKSVLLYDGDCGFCQWSVDQIKKRDSHGRFDYTANYSYPALTPELTERTQHEVVLIQPGKVLGGADAALSLYCTLKPWSPLQIFRVPPLLWLARVAYRWVANHRLQISRWLKLPTSCQIPAKHPASEKTLKEPS